MAPATESAGSYEIQGATPWARKMASQRCLIDVPLIAKMAKAAGDKEEITVEIVLPNGVAIDLVLLIFGAPREERQAGAETCQGVCW